MERFENYELRRELGRGATAKIFLAQHATSHEQVSLKIFHPKMFHDPQFSQRIQREIEVSTNLRHRNIVKVREVLQNTDPPALVMDYVDGENLERFQGRLPYVLPEISVLITIEILKALEYAHGEGLIHRDLKPENVLIRNDGRVFVTDFGLAKVQEMTMITQANVIVGSIDYMSPEQARGENLTPQSDLFSLATILYFLTTGTRPFSRATTVATLHAIKEESPESPQKRNPKLSGELCRLIQKGLEKDPANRFKNATEFRQALQKYVTDLGLTDDSFSLIHWAKDPSGYVFQALQVSVEKITAGCQHALKEKKWDAFLNHLSHLSLKAPDSPALAHLTEEYRKVKQSPRKKHILLALLLLLVLTGTGVALYPQISQLFQSGQKAKPVTLSEAQLNPQALGSVQFNVADDITVFWDGKKVDATQPLMDQTVGEHDLQLTRPGFPPIKTKVKVTLQAPAVVNVK